MKTMHFAAVALSALAIPAAASADPVPPYHGLPGCHIPMPQTPGAPWYQTVPCHARVVTR
jgi:opacity protein-like surface antigen